MSEGKIIGVVGFIALLISVGCLIYAMQQQNLSYNEVAELRCRQFCSDNDKQFVYTDYDVCYCDGYRGDIVNNNSFFDSNVDYAVYGYS